MEKIYPHCAYEELETSKRESGRTNIATIATIGTGLLALAGTATLLKIGCEKYFPQICNYFNFK